MSNKTAEWIEELSDDTRIKYTLEMAPGKWWCTASKQRLNATVVSKGWKNENWFKRGFDGVEKPSNRELRDAFQELREACIKGEDLQDILDTVMVQVVDEN